MSFVRSNLFYEREQWKRPLLLSAGFHLFLAGSIVLTGYLLAPRATTNWGQNTGDAVNATLISASALPIPHVEESKNIVANESKGVTETKPQPKPVETEDGIAIPNKDVKVKPKPQVKTPPTIARPHPAPTPEETAVPYGERGPVSGPYGSFSAPHTEGGFSFQDASFGSRFAYYV